MRVRFARWIRNRNVSRLDEAVVGLRTSQEALLQFGRKSDRDFTALARGLGHLNQRLAELRTQAEQLDLILGDRDEDRAISSAHALYKSSVDLVHASMGTALSEQDQIKGIEDNLLHACGAHAKFKRNQLLLSILTMGVRMEASRVDAEFQGVFLNVAAAIGEISEKIAASTSGAFARIEAVIAEARTERQHLKDLEQNLLGRAQTSIRRIERELEALKQSLQPCVAASRGITELLSNVGPATLRTLASLQHQDIVRQQLEHVAAGFDDLRQHLHEDGSAANPAAKLELGYVHHAASVQQAHLRAARSEIEKAVTEVTSGLQAILSVGGQLVERFTAMESAGCAAFRDFQVARMFREEIHQLAQIAEMSEQANDKISGLVDRIADVVRVFSKEISLHDLDVKIVALNAQIAAARLPSADALNKLAEETSKVSGENAEITRDLIADLQSCLAGLVAVKSDADEFLGIVTSEKAELERGVVMVSDRLNRLGERVQARSAQVRSDFEAAHRETHELLASLGFPALVARSYEPAERLCELLLAATASHADPEDLTAEASARLESHRGRYTMHKESATHNAALSGGAAAAAAMEAVELFATEDPPPAPAGNPRSSEPAPAALEPALPGETGNPPGGVDPAEPVPVSPLPPENPPPPAGPQAVEENLGDGIELF